MSNPSRSNWMIARLWRRVDDLLRAPYTTGLPEWHMFPDDETRRRSIRSIERNMMPRSFRSQLEFLLAVILFLGVPYAVSYLITRYALPGMGPWNDRILWALALIGYVAIVAVMIRRDIVSSLRRKLIEVGVPICAHCGYDLRGLTAAHSRCPECGRELEAAVKAILGGTTSRGGNADDDPRAPDAPAV